MYQEEYSKIIKELRIKFDKENFIYRNDMYLTYNLGEYKLCLNRYDLSMNKDRTTLPLEEVRKFYHLLRSNNTQNQFIKRWKERRSIINFVERYLEDYDSIIHYESPDFIVDNKCGVEF